eukprot:s2780_g9.t1
MALFAKAFVQGAAPPVLPVSRLSSTPGRPLHEALDRGVPSAVAVAATVLVAGVTTKRRSPITRSAVAMRATAKKKKPTTKKLISPQRRVQRLFVEEFKKTMFSPNPWYECPEETFPGGTKRIYDWWMTTRPTRDIEKICDGRDGCGCTWKQMDGRRGVSYVTFNEDGQVVYVREVGEPQGVGKFKDNTMKSLQPVMGVMNVITGALNFAEPTKLEHRSLWPQRTGMTMAPGASTATGFSVGGGSGMGSAATTGMPSSIPKRKQASVVEMLEYVKGLNIDPIREADMLWIAEEAFNAPLPPGWSEHQDTRSYVTNCKQSTCQRAVRACQTAARFARDEQGRVYFHNGSSGESTWKHPMDDLFREIVDYQRRVVEVGGFWQIEDEIAEQEENIRKDLADWMELFAEERGRF